MPKEMHDKLRREGKKKGMSGKRLQAYIYGTMQKMGMMHKGKKQGKKP